MIAHAVTGSPLWNLRTETQTCRNEAVAESVETSAAEARFDEKRRAVLALLDFAPDEPTVIGGNGMDEDTSAIFARLLALPDGDVLAVLAVIMGETLEAGSAVVEAVGGYLGVDKLGRTSCRERVGRSAYSSVVDGSIKKKKK